MDLQSIHEKAKELVELKKEIKVLHEKEKLLKNDLLPLIKEYGAVNCEFGRVYYVRSKGTETFSRKHVIQYLRDSYGDELANQVDMACTKQGEPKEVLYVKLTGFDENL